MAEPTCADWVARAKNLEKLLIEEVDAPHANAIAAMVVLLAREKMWRRAQLAIELAWLKAVLALVGR